MGEVIEGRGGHLDIAKKAGPFAEALVHGAHGKRFADPTLNN